MAQRRRGSVKPAKTILDPKTGRPKPAAGTTWLFAVDVGEGSNRRQVKRRGFATKAAAQEELTALLERSRTNRHVDYSRATLGEFLTDEWLPELKLDVANGRLQVTTWSRYASDVRLHVLPHTIADRPMQRVDAGDLKRHWAELAQKTVKSLGKKPLSSRSVESVAVTLRKALNDAIRMGRRLDNPTSQSMPAPGHRSPRKVWTAEQVAAFLAWDRRFVPASRAESTAEPRVDLAGWQGDRLYALWLLFATSGMRRGEALALDWDRDLHLEPDACTCSPRNPEPHLVIDRAIRVLRGQDLTADDAGVTGDELERGWQWSGPKTEAGYRLVSLDPFTVDALREWRARQNAERLAIGAGWRRATGPTGEPMNLVFTDLTGGVLLPKLVTDVFLRRTSRFGVPLNLHGLRHTWATIALERGVHPKVVQSRLGHTRIQTTLDLYSHVRPAVDAAAAATVADAITSSPVPTAPPLPTEAVLLAIRPIG